MMKRIVFLLFSIIIFCLALVLAKPVDTELIRAFISPQNKVENYIVNLANISSKKIKVGSKVEILAIDGVKLNVKEVKEED